ncbi:MAG: 50S ribosomal protein L11 methyltransferase [Gallionellales bacterium CG_4_10_14_3_um_filter_54_96]|nr:MAG: ribosomal protein L11 methyltransferase [Gallionellaceae bacterium CG1_02_56_997]PIX03522.1 MAG: 50S ribosomal protein L11 methyltransferase [Gallionellales bacterium CG_4_8_14_3_um_filter_54_18]PIY05252.1 MAG: 50S ribosomal protein L11 methyltransferase [Gallionellales bacterium CG_4_10_14_3_um_filter_54_96]PJC04131.1 MAG: 50S ribosomal protein L11 methyltransferase [Gallionellales bacterium CG_4_9_14_0_8_um_filter_55_61]HCJ52074.1 50S ribosomal protein L11 methyltransferase [Gallionel
MAWLTLLIDTDAAHAEALSDALLEHGALAVDLLDADADTPDEQAIFGEPGEPPPGVWQHNRISALFDADRDVDAILRQAAGDVGLSQLPRHSITTLDDQDWVRLTQAQFEPIPISDRLWIVPTWHTPSNPDAINIVLDPGLAFGTGSHPTTRLCLRWLDNNLQGNERLLDYGCGSGILAIAAIKLGAASAIGIDVDAQAVTASRDNACANQVENVAFFLPNDAPKDEYDLVVANILTNPLRLLAPLLAGSTKQGGQIVLSGILEAQAQDVTNLYQQWFDLNAPIFEDGWTCLSGRKR